MHECMRYDPISGFMYDIRKLFSLGRIVVLAYLRLQQPRVCSAAEIQPLSRHSPRLDVHLWRAEQSAATQRHVEMEFQ